MTNLEMKVNTTQVGLYTVTYGYVKAPLAVQEAKFAGYALHTISPAELGHLRAGIEDSLFIDFSRTNMDVFYDDRDGGRVVLTRGGLLGKSFSIDLVKAHGENKELIIPENQRRPVYGIIDAMLENGVAFATEHGEHTIDTSKFGDSGLTGFIFSDPSLGIRAADYGTWLKDSQGRATQQLFFDSRDYATLQKGPYLNRLCVFGPDGCFDVDGNGKVLDYSDGAFGVTFIKSR